MANNQLTIEEFLEQLPSPVKELAQANRQKTVNEGTWIGIKKHKTADSLKQAILFAFPWEKSKEGYAKWYAVFNNLKYNVDYSAA